MFFEIKKYFLYHKNKLYYIQRVLKESNKPKIDRWKKHLNTDLVLKKDGLFYLLEEIEEAQIIEENE